MGLSAGEGAAAAAYLEVGAAKLSALSVIATKQEDQVPALLQEAGPGVWDAAQALCDRPVQV